MGYMEEVYVLPVPLDVSSERAHLYYREERNVDVALDLYWCTYRQICTQETLFTWSVGNGLLSLAHFSLKYTSGVVEKSN